MGHAAVYTKTVGDPFLSCLRPDSLIYASNVDSLDPNLELNTKQFHDLLSSLSTRVEEFDPIQSPHSTNQQKQQEDRERLQKLASDLIQDTQKLEQVLQKAANATPKWKLPVVALKYRISHKRIVDDLEKKIQDAHRILNLEFLTRIW